MASVSQAQMDVLRHSLGLSYDGHGPVYRNHFVTGKGSTDYADCMALVDAGLMVKRAGSDLTGGDDLFFVTDAGKVLAIAEPPKLTRSQRRYRDFLNADCGMRFGEWLRATAPTQGEAK